MPLSKTPILFASLQFYQGSAGGIAVFFNSFRPIANTLRHKRPLLAPSQ